MALSTDTRTTTIIGVVTITVTIPATILALWKIRQNWRKNCLSRNSSDEASTIRHATIPEGGQSSSETTEIQLEEGLYQYHYMSRFSGTNGVRVDMPQSPATTTVIMR
ncbi:hypothetical protein BBP40_008344 [Aspergillus hancockii]|nr:hypothetical protein BBP40_008344 [Aspergillus hancockii]